MVLAHLSDLHFGKLYDAHVVDCLISDVRASGADAVVISGDLTQRARKREWAGARMLIDALAVEPTIVIPGNHDVFAWWFPLRRLITPLARYKHYIRPELDVEWSDGPTAVLALNDAHGWTVKGGWFRRRQIERVRNFGQSFRDAEYRVLVVHHQIVPSSISGPGDVAVHSAELLDAAAEAQFDCVLDGHIHRSANQLIAAEAAPSRKFIQCTAGTTTSSRGRFEDTGRNLYNLIRFGTGITVDERRYDADGRRFTSYRSTSYERATSGGGWVRVASPVAGDE